VSNRLDGWKGIQGSMLKGRSSTRQRIHESAQSMRLLSVTSEYHFLKVIIF
jgi:hypothetical protein